MLRHVLDFPLAAELTREEGRSIVLVFLCTTLGAVLSRWHLRLILPTVVVEIVLGILIGPEALGIATVNEYITFLSNFGLALLFFFAGLEVIEHHVPPRDSCGAGPSGWGMSLAIGVAFGVGLESAGVDVTWWLLAVALATTALGTLVPILSDARLLPTPIGQAVLGTGVAGEFWPIIFISVFLTSVYGALTEVLLLVGFGALVAVAATLALRTRPPRVLRILQDTLHTTGQVGVRASIFVLALLVFVAADAGFEFVLGAFAAGVLVGLVLDSPEGEVVRDAPRGDRLRLPRPGLLRRHGHELRHRQLAHGRGALARGDLPRPPARHARRVGFSLAPRARPARNGEPRAVRRHRASADRRDRRDRLRARRRLRQRRSVADRRRDDLRARLSLHRDAARRARTRTRMRLRRRSRLSSTRLCDVAKPTVDPTARFFAELAGRAHEPLLRKATGRFRFDVVDGRRTRRWLVAVEGGNLAVTVGSGEANCVVRADKAVFDKLASGRLNPVAAVLRGDLQVDGDWRLLVLMQRLFPGPRASRRRKATS